MIYQILTSDLFQFIILADDTKCFSDSGIYVQTLPRSSILFYSNKVIEILYRVVNEELDRASVWFRASKLVVNNGEKRVIF